MPPGYWNHAVGRGAWRGFAAAAVFGFGLLGVFAVASGDVGALPGFLVGGMLFVAPICLVLGAVPGAVIGAVIGAVALRWRWSPVAFARWCGLGTFLASLPVFVYAVQPGLLSPMDAGLIVVAAMASAVLGAVAAARHAAAVLRRLRDC